MKRTTRGRALFLHRDSGGKHETTPGEYVRWAQQRAKELGVRFSGTPETIESMIAEGTAVDSDVFLDYEVPGNELSRKALDAMVKEIQNDVTVSHVMIPNRDRLARPEDPFDGVRLENKLRKMGVAVVFMDKVLAPMSPGQATDIGEAIEAVVGYHRSGEEVRTLSKKMIYSQLGLAKNGYSCGGRPPHGFRRFLVSTNGAAVRELEDGELVKREHHHVMWLPKDKGELEVVRRVYRMLDDLLPAGRVATTFMEEGIPTPDAGRERADGGRQHKTAGVWHQTTIVDIARNPIYKGEIRYGRRSMGRLNRQTPDGPRILEDDDFRVDGKPKIIRNQESLHTTAKATFPPVVDPELWARVNAILDERGKSQRGKPRSRDPSRNPLGGRVFDMSCTWRMYRTPYKETFRYQCGLYMQSHGQRCSHNTVTGPEATAFVLSAIRSRVLSRSLIAKIKRRVREIAEAEKDTLQVDRVVASKESRLLGVNADLRRAGKNMALADTDEHRAVMAEVYDELQEAKTALERELAEARGKEVRPRDVKTEVRAALSMLERLEDLAAEPGDLRAVGELFRALNVNLFLSFEARQVGKRKLNKLVGGVLTMGNAELPIEPYKGRTARREVKSRAGAHGARSSSRGGTERESPPPEAGNSRRVDSLGNVGRGDWI